MTTYSIHDDWLYDSCGAIKKIDCDRNKFSAGNNICDYIVFHYTASTTSSSAHRTFKKVDTPVSWHLTIDTDGSLYQLYDFRKITWHAGRSAWRKPSGQPISGMNKYAIGIEIINAGPLTKKNGVYKTWFDQTIDEKDVFIDDMSFAWHAYTPAQLHTAEVVVKPLIERYNCIDVLSHEMISPNRKQDTGPAFEDTLKKIRKKYNFI